MDRIATLLQNIEVFQCPTDLSRHREADTWIRLWQESEFALTDSLELVRNSSDNRVLFLAMTTLMRIIRSFAFLSLTEDVVSNLVSCLFEFAIKHQCEPEKESVRFALICIADISLKIRSDQLTMANIWAQLPTPAMRTQALRVFMEDANEPFCKTNDVKRCAVSPEDFDFGMEQLAVLECNEVWLQILQAMINIATNNQVFLRLIPRWKECLGDLRLIQLLISIIAQFLVTESGSVDVHLVVLEFGLNLSIYLRRMFEQTGNGQLLTLTGELWTNMFDISDENVTFLKHVELMAGVYDEFFICTDLLLSNFGNIPNWENQDWMYLVKSTIDMCQCFGENACNVGHPLESFVTRALDFIRQALDKGFVFEEQRASLALLYQSAPELALNYLTEHLPSRSPSLLVLVALLQKDCPVELVNLYADHLNEFTPCPPYNLIFFVSMAADALPERLPQFVDILLSLFPACADLVSHYLQKVVVNHGKVIVETRPQVIQLLAEAMDHLSHDATKNAVIILADLSMHVSLELLGPILDVIGKAIVRLCSDPHTVKTGLSLMTEVIETVTDSRPDEPVVQRFSATMCAMIMSSHRQLWECPDFEIQSHLALMMAVCLKRGLVPKEGLDFVVSWINAMICRVEIGEYLLCLPFLTDYFPIPNVREFLMEYSPNRGSDPILRHVITCLGWMFRKFGADTWNLVPLELLGKCFLSSDSAQALELFRLVRTFVDLIPAPYVPTLLNIILHETAFKYQYLITDRAGACMVAIGRRHPDAFIKCFYDALPVPDSIELAKMMIATPAVEDEDGKEVDPDTLPEEARKMFAQMCAVFRTQVQNR